MKELRKRKRFKSKYICSPFIAPVAKRLKVGGRDGEYDSFKAWVEEIDGIEPTVLHLDIPSSYPTNRTFFRELMDENEWLSSEHLDALVLLFRKSIKIAAYELMSPLFAYQILQKDAADDKQWKGDRLLKKMDWSRYEKVFMPVHTDGKHWVLSEIDLLNNVVRVYDSLKTSRSVASVRLLCIRLPLLFWVIKCNPVVTSIAHSHPWRVEAVDDVPQQHSGYTHVCTQIQFVCA
ncbi:unnamed protein product [Cuscuta europaea]|uniref:Ubiquitin-like protease family profile domain-containing protein n=1 Tax=Cuscuta europaea TaxID=41803 RepID=A0A9P0ZAA5_CUSEU|nr:unnamed protein product [Cuscuta europaea]